MKIISKFKDYYDYLSGVWGVDEIKFISHWMELPKKPKL